MSIRAILESFIHEDLVDGDSTGALLDKTTIQARIITRQDGIISGAKYASTIFGMRDCQAHVIIQDREYAHSGDTIMSIQGNAADMLSLERTALNLMSRMSGIATLTKRLVSSIPKDVRLLATRKTAPGLRIFDKEAVEDGGGMRHRMNLGEMIMIKDNHVSVEGSLECLIKKAQLQKTQFEVEVDTLSDCMLAATLGAPIILLDNFTPDQIQNAILELERVGLRDSVKLEASGGITAENITLYGATGVDYISLGYITNSAPSLDMSLEV